MSVYLPNFFRGYLATALSASTATSSVVLDRITNLNGESLETADLSTLGKGVITVNPEGDGVTSYPESISFTGITSATKTLTGCVRGLNKAGTTTTSYMRYHPVGTPVIISFGVHQISDLITYLNSLVVSTRSVIVSGTAGETLVAGNLVYFDDTDNEWKKTDADTAASVENTMLGIAQGAGVDGGTIATGVLLLGKDLTNSGLTAGQKYFASNTAGGISTTTGTKEVSIGFGTVDGFLYFQPRYDQQLTEDQQDALEGTSGTPSSSNKFVTNNDTATTTAVSKVIRATTSGYLDSTWLNILKFGGDGSDGALTITSGTITISAASAAVLIKNYTSISITGTGKLAFSDPASTGTTIILKSTGNVTLTSSTIPNIDASGMGAVGGTGGNGNSSGNASDGTAGTTALGIFDDSSHGGGLGGGGQSSGTAGTAGTAGNIYTNLNFYLRDVTKLARLMLGVAPGSGGGGGGGGATVSAGVVSNGGNGGRGGGALLIFCGGALDFTSALGVSVAGTNGSTASNADASAVGSRSAGAGGGGGAGAGGFCVILYNSLTSASGTINTAGGAGGAGGNAIGGQSGGGSAGAGGGGGAGAGCYGGAGGAGGAGRAGPGAGGNGSGGSSAGGSRAGGGGGGGAFRNNSDSAGTFTGGAAGAAGSSENVLVAKNDYFI